MKAYIQISLTIIAALAAVVVTVTAVVIGGYYYVAPSLPRAEELRTEMQALAKELRYEEAARVRDRLHVLEAKLLEFE